MESKINPMLSVVLWLLEQRLHTDQSQHLGQAHPWLRKAVTLPLLPAEQEGWIWLDGCWWDFVCPGAQSPTVFRGCMLPVGFEEPWGWRWDEQELLLGWARLKHKASSRSTANFNFWLPSVSWSCKVKPYIVLAKQLISRDCMEPCSQAGYHVSNTIKVRGFHQCLFVLRGTNCKLQEAIGLVWWKCWSGSGQFAETDLISLGPGSLQDLLEKKIPKCLKKSGVEWPNDLEFVLMGL